MTRFTSEFGMESGGTTSLCAPGNRLLQVVLGSADRIMNSLLTPEMSDNCVEVLANSQLLAANFALFSKISGITCFVQIQSVLPLQTDVWNISQSVSMTLHVLSNMNLLMSVSYNSCVPGPWMGRQSRQAL